MVFRQMIKMSIWLGTLAIMLAPFSHADPGLACGARRYCRQMRSCAEVAYYFEKCRLLRLDGDHDGIPCERICGKTLAAYERNKRLKGRRLFFNPGSVVKDRGANTNFTCGAKRYCRQMRSCAEAKFYLATCGLLHLDGIHDGIPCNRLCR